jgi:HSP20 family protein
MLVDKMFRELESFRPVLEDAVTAFTDIAEAPRYRRTYVEENSVILELALPGLSKEEIEIKIEEGILSISHENEKMDFWKRSFDKRFRLRDDVDQANISATMENGVLKVSMPLVEEEKADAKTIVIK